MVLSKKRKQQLKQMTAQSIKTRKRQKANGETRQQMNALRRQREDEDCWDEYKDPCSESSSDESDCNKLSSNESSSDKENMVVEDKRVIEETLGDNPFEELGESDRGVQFKNKEWVFNPSWRPGVDDYLWQTQRCSSKATEKQKKKEKRERKKLVSETKSLVDMF
ncbi:hypothetical protein MMC22_010308 [Lobaria immixta]|nr:hypothetical protein [Lobaria immixta]